MTADERSVRFNDLLNMNFSGFIRVLAQKIAKG